MNIADANTASGNNSETATTSPTAFSFGFYPCPILATLTQLWVDFAWDLDIWHQEIMPHKRECALCRDHNPAAMDAFHGWKDEQLVAVEMEETNGILNPGNPDTYINYPGVYQLQVGQDTANI